MSLVCARRSRYSGRFLSSLIFALFCTASSGVQQAGGARQLFLLSGTPTEKRPQAYPVMLYRVGANKNLKLVRQVVPQADGLRVVRAWGDVLFVIHPHIAATTASIVHPEDPALKDDVVFSSKAVYPSTALTVIAAPVGLPLELLVPWITDSSDPSHPSGTVVGISSGRGQLGSRVKFDVWDHYAVLRYEGGTGGPEVVAPLVGTVIDGHLGVTLFGHSMVLESLPPALRLTNRKLLLNIVAASHEYLLLTPRGGSPPEKLGASEEYFIHDRVKKLWRTIRNEGNWSQSRLFGHWLATIVRMANLDGRPGPGRDVERSEGTERLPNVQAEYASWAGRYYWMPGVLTVQNLEDGRKIRIETGQEDSEILRVENDVVLYRVNDTIYQAKIVGDRLKDTTVLVKDEDVPEIHWVFWSK